MAKGSYKTEGCGAFLLSIIKHSDLKVVQYEAVGKEHGITAHSAYCRFNGIKNALKAESQIKAAVSENAENKPPTQSSPSKKRARKASPNKARGKRGKEESNTTTGSEDYNSRGLKGNMVEDDGEEELLASPSKKQKRKGTAKVEKIIYESEDSDWIE
ncbi:hypothetical protein TWF730_005410 [Orbilia blumenaviensis]|uniref:Myb-like DNA-binding domain-containing protein n=1 Tax=Orbilia blumenaviensis TaxID=1796055 RepID=A0AAV9VL63_9PEZI